MAKIIIFLIICLFLVGCATQQSTISKDETTKPVTKEVVESEIKEESGFLTEKLSFEDEELSGEVIKNKLTKTAEIKITMKIPDEVENMNLLGEEVSGVPFIVNFGCSLFAVGFFDPEQIKDWQESGNVTAESGKDYLEGYTVKRITYNFIDKENNEKIADCTAIGSKWEDIKFNAYRTYENTMFGVQIGEQPEEQ